MKRAALVLLWVGMALGQTRVSWRQLQPGGHTQPRVAWQDGMGGPRVSRKQIPTHATIVEVVTVDGRAVLQVTEPVPCRITPKPGFWGIIQVAWYAGRVGVLAGHNTDQGYQPTANQVDVQGPCILLDTQGGRYPKHLHGFIAFATLGMPRTSAPLRVLATPFVPSGYNMDPAGLTGVTGHGGQATFLP